MDSDMKWAMIAIIAMVVIPLAALGINSYQQNQCRLAGIEKGMPADDIIKLCKEIK